MSEILENDIQTTEALAETEAPAEGAAQESVVPAVTDLASGFAALLAKEGEAALANNAAITAVFADVAELEREKRLLQVFLACDGPKTLAAAMHNDAAQGVARKKVIDDMTYEYWLAEDGATMICNAFMAAFGGEAVEETLCDQANRYYNGDGVPQDKEKAAALFEEAALAGDVVAQYTLGYMLDKGDGVDKDRVAAVKWYAMAAEQGHESAQNRLAILNKTQVAATEKPADDGEAAPKKKKFFGR